MLTVLRRRRHGPNDEGAVAPGARLALLATLAGVSAVATACAASASDVPQAGRQLAVVTMVGSATTSTSTVAPPVAPQAQRVSMPPHAAAFSTAALPPSPGCTHDPQRVSSGTVARGNPPPDFTATTFDCRLLTLASAIRGRPALINFFASWCHGCRDEAADIEGAYRDYNTRNGFLVVGIDTFENNGDDGPSFYRRFGLTYPAVHDPNQAIANAYGVDRTLPVSIFVRHDGTIDRVVIGAITRAQIDREMASL